MLELNKLYLCDCMEGMKKFPDKYFELAIVDPPYGIDIVGAIKKSTKENASSMFKMTKCGNGYDFDKSIPDKSYFDELFRVSKNQIIWGGNYFLDYLKSTNGFAIWDKMNGTNPMADAELAWTSFEKSSKMFRMHHFSSGYGTKIHPTQKPVALYTWLLNNYAKKGDKILDTHVGSASSLIACYRLGFEYIGFELDPDYYKSATVRLEAEKSQMNLFQDLPEPAEQHEQGKFI